MSKTKSLNKLRVVMADKHLTNAWLADKLNVSEITVSRWRNNKIQPSIGQFIEIAYLLKLDIRDLLEADFNYNTENEK